MKMKMERRMLYKKCTRSVLRTIHAQRVSEYII